MAGLISFVVTYYLIFLSNKNLFGWRLDIRHFEPVCESSAPPNLTPLQQKIPKHRFRRRLDPSANVKSAKP